MEEKKNINILNKWVSAPNYCIREVSADVSLYLALYIFVCASSLALYIFVCASSLANGLHCHIGRKMISPMTSLSLMKTEEKKGLNNKQQPQKRKATAAEINLKQYRDHTINISSLTFLLLLLLLLF